MSFIGAINEKLRRFFYTHARILEGRTCYIGCSGNFTIEQIITRACPSATFYSNDVSLYSSVIGHMLTGEPLPQRFIAATGSLGTDHFKKASFHSQVSPERLDLIIQHLMKLRKLVLAGTSLKNAIEDAA